MPVDHHAVRKLEDDLDTLIFDRSGYQAELDAHRQVLLEWGRALLQQADQLQSQIAGAKGWELERPSYSTPSLPGAGCNRMEAYFAKAARRTAHQWETRWLVGRSLLDGRADLIIAQPMIRRQAWASVRSRCSTCRFPIACHQRITGQRTGADQR